MTNALIGKTVNCVIGSKFLPNSRGNPIAVPNRSGGVVLGRDQYGNLEVRWPNGEVYSYEDALLVAS